MLVTIRRRGVVNRVLASQPGSPGSISSRIRIFYFYPGTGCLFFVFCPVLSPAVVLTMGWPLIQKNPPLCFCLVSWSAICCFPYSHLTHGYFGLQVSRGVSPTFIINRVFCQGQVLHCKDSNLACSSVEARSSTSNSGTESAILPEIE